MRTYQLLAALSFLVMAGCTSHTARIDNPLPSAHPLSGADMRPGASWRTTAASSHPQGRWVVSRDPGMVLFVSPRPGPDLRTVTAAEFGSLAVPPPSDVAGPCRIELGSAGRAGAVIDRTHCDHSPLGEVVSWRQEGAGMVLVRRNGRPIRVTIID